MSMPKLAIPQSKIIVAGAAVLCCDLLAHLLAHLQTLDALTWPHQRYAQRRKNSK